MQSGLGYAEECLLCGRAQAGDDEARNRLVMSHLGLARRLARNVARRTGGDVDDPTQEAVVGLIRATRTFDPTTHPGMRFGKYAVRWMRKCIATAVAAARTIRMPDYAYALATSAADDSDLPAGRRRVRDAAARILAAEFRSEGLAETQARDVRPNDDGEEVAAGLNALPLIQRHVLNRLYGLDGSPPTSLKGAAREVGCSVWAVRRIARTALDGMRLDLGRKRPPRPDVPRRDCAYPKKCNPNRRKG